METNPFLDAPAPQLVEFPGLTLLGPSVRTTNAQEMSGNDGKIGPLWGRFLQGGAEAIPDVLEPDVIYAAYTNYESDETGAYDLILGKSVRKEKEAPLDMKLIHLPPDRYLVFPAAGNSPAAIKAAWLSVYDYFSRRAEQTRAFTTDFEQHTHSSSKIFIAIR